MRCDAVIEDEACYLVSTSPPCKRFTPSFTIPTARSARPLEAGSTRNVLDTIVSAEILKLFTDETSGVVTDDDIRDAASAKRLSQFADSDS